MLPAFGDYPNGALMALGSGSRPSRHRGALLALDAAGDIQVPAVYPIAPLSHFCGGGCGRGFQRRYDTGPRAGGGSVHGAC